MDRQSNTPAIITRTREPEPTPEGEDEEFLGGLNLRDAVDRKLANLMPIAAMAVGKKAVPDMGVYIIRKVDRVLKVYGPVTDQKAIRAILRHLPN